MMKLFRKKHELWLEVLFASFSTTDAALKAKLYDFSMMEFRHLKWLTKELKAQNLDINYERALHLQKPTTLFELLETLVRSIRDTQAYYEPEVLSARMHSDENELLLILQRYMQLPSNNHEITAFDRKRQYDNLDQTQNDTLALFLFEELYKEYELILIYFYLQFHTDDIKQYDVFQDLIDESHFHLKSFGNMMAKMGILALPRELHEMTYKISDIQTFLLHGIDEEKNAKEQCRILSEKIYDEELSNFFNFINNQESYHIELMQSLLDANN